MRRARPTARHHCTAFVIGSRSMLQRSNDDGEPSGTAGAPMLEVLTRRGISDTVVVVTRWFGGTLLGAGGLVRAYGDVTGAALDLAGEQVRVLRHVARVEVGQAEAGPLDNRLRALGVVTDVAYAERVVFTLHVEDPDRFVAEVAHLTAGSAVVELDGTAWVDLP